MDLVLGANPDKKGQRKHHERDVYVIRNRLISLYVVIFL